MDVNVAVIVSQVGFFPSHCVELIDTERRKSTESVSKAGTPQESGTVHFSFLSSVIVFIPGTVSSHN